MHGHGKILSLCQYPALKSTHCEWSEIHGTVDFAANTHTCSRNLFPEKCAHQKMSR